MNRLVIVGLFICINITNTTHAQIDLSEYKQTLFSPFAYNSELTTNRAYHIIQDSRDLMWFGTDDGLNKYDGTSIKQYTHDPEDSTSIGYGYIMDILPNEDGTLWLSTFNGGLTRYDHEYDIFEHLTYDATDTNSVSSNDVRALFRDSNDRVWVGTFGGGLCLFDEQNKSFKRIPNTPAIFSNNVYDIEEGGNGILLLDTGVPGEIVEFDIKTGIFKKIIYDDDVINLGGVDVSDSKTILNDSQGDIWITTNGNGLYCLRGEDILNFGSDVISSEITSDIIEDHKGIIWIGTYGGGLMSYDRTSGKFSTSKYIYQDKKSISSNVVLSLFEDNSQLIWIGTNSGGVSVYDNNQTGFKHLTHSPTNNQSLSHNIVLGMEEDKFGNIWLGTDGGGLNKLNPDFTFTRIKHNSENSKSITGDVVVDIASDSNGDLWLGTYGEGLSVYSPTNNTSINYLDGNGALGQHSVWSTLHDKEGNAWVGTLGGGIFYFDKIKNTISKYHNTANDSLKSSSILTLFEDKENTIWVGLHHNGIAQITKEDRLVKLYQFEEKELKWLNFLTPRCFFEDSKSRLWVGLEGAGLVLLKGEQIKIYNESKGLPNEKIMGILEDDHGNLWISTNDGGLSKFDPSTELFTNYTKEDGLQSNEFSKKSYLKTSNGVMLFGGIDGLNIFHPDSIKEDVAFPEVILTSFKIFDVEAAIGDVIDKHINIVKNATLDYTQSVFSIEFSAIKFRLQKSIQYSYLLEGFDENWRSATKERKATYTNLAAGSYIFRVKASNSLGEWGASDRELIINIVAPWWQKMWFKVLLVVMLVFILLALYYYNVKSIRNKKIVLELLVKKRTVELEKSYETVQKKNNKIKKLNENLEKTVEKRTIELTKQNERMLDYLAHNSHIVRGPLARILGLTYLIKMSKDPEEMDDIVNKIADASQELDLIVSKINRVLEGEKGKDLGKNQE